MQFSSPAPAGRYSPVIVGRRARSVCGGGFLIVCLAGCGVGGATRDVAVDRYDVALTVLADASLDVRETITVRAEAPAGARFARDVDATRVDRIHDVQAALDGGSIVSSGGSLRVDRSGALHVVWPVAAVGRSPHTLTLHYRLAGALPLIGTRRILRWPALPVDRAYRVAAVRVDLVVPPDSEFTAGPDLEGGRAPVVRRSGGATVEIASMAPEDPAVLSAEIILASPQDAAPEWQTSALRAHQLMPAFVSAGVCLAVVGLGVLVMIRLQYPHPRPMAGENDLAVAMPAPPAPDVAAALTRPGVRDRALVNELVKSGLIETERLSVARGLRATGIVALVLAAAGALASEVWLSRFGVWPMAVPLGLAVMAVLFLRAAARMPVLSQAGERAARALGRQYTSRL